jgi:hypothetical protein
LLPLLLLPLQHTHPAAAVRHSTHQQQQEQQQGDIGLQRQKPRSPRQQQVQRLVVAAVLAAVCAGFQSSAVVSWQPWLKQRVTHLLMTRGFCLTPLAHTGVF